MTMTVRSKLGYSACAATVHRGHSTPPIGKGNTIDLTVDTRVGAMTARPHMKDTEGTVATRRLPNDFGHDTCKGTSNNNTLLRYTSQTTALQPPLRLTTCLTIMVLVFTLCSLPILTLTAARTPAGDDCPTAVRLSLYRR